MNIYKSVSKDDFWAIRRTSTKTIHDSGEVKKESYKEADVSE